MRQPDPWPERARFRELVDAWMDRHPGQNRGRLREELAHQIGIAPEYLRQLYSGRTKSPGLDVIRRMAEVLGCSITELIQDRGPVLEMDPQELDAYSIEEQYDLRALGTNLRRLDHETRARVIKAWRAVLESAMPTKASIDIQVIRRGKKE